MLTSALYETILNNSPTGHYLLSPSTDPIILAVNDTFLKTVSRQREEIVGKKLFEAFPGDPQHADNGTEVLRKSLNTVLKTGKEDKVPLQCYPITVTLPDGKVAYQERFWDAINTPLFDDDGRLLYISHYTTDITEKVQADKALINSQQRFLSLSQSIDEGYCVIEMIFNDHEEPIDYIFREVNHMFEFQTDLRQVIGKSMRELAPQHEKYWFEIYGKVSKTGTAIRFESEAKALKRWYDVYAYQVSDIEKNLIGVLFRDITLRKHQEEALRESEARLRALITATAGVVYRMSPDWKQLHQLEGRGFLKNANNANEFWLDEYIPVEDQTLVHKAIEVAIRDKAPFVLEHRVLQADGSYGWTDTRAVPMFNDAGEILEWIGAASDITDRKIAEEELHKTGRRKDDFLAMLAHELRNPLAPIKAAADLLSLVNLSDVKVRQTSEIISRQVKHMTGLVDDLLDVSRVTRGLVTLDKTKLDIKKIIADSVEQVRPLIEARKHQLVVHITPELAFVLGDQKRLIQVLSNLLNNAAKYTPEGGAITLSMELEGGDVRITVKDNGIGMAPEMVKQAFDLFTQAARTSDRSQGGLGIGLALVKSLVELHEGSISVKSLGTAQGSEFILCLPRLNEAGDLEANPVEKIEKTAKQALNILVVDDNIDAAVMLQMLLEAYGHHVIVENGSQAALMRVKNERLDVIVLDIGLPEMDGYEVARSIRRMPLGAGFKLIALTGYGQAEDLIKADVAGFDHHLVKPLDSKKLTTILNAIKA